MPLPVPSQSPAPSCSAVPPLYDSWAQDLLIHVTKVAEQWAGPGPGLGAALWKTALISGFIQGHIGDQPGKEGRAAVLSLHGGGGGRG